MKGRKSNRREYSERNEEKGKRRETK